MSYRKSVNLDNTPKDPNLELGCFCRIRNTTIFGTYHGPVESKYLKVLGTKYCRESLGLSNFYVEGLSAMIKVKTSRLEVCNRHQDA
jgi:hypothetical protein